MQNNSSVTLVLPCYNEEANIQKGVLDKIGNYTKNRNIFKEVIVVDDGSTDESKKIIKEKYLRQFSKFTLIENSHKGKAFAIITGVLESTSSHVMFSDIDLATPIEESEKLLQQIKNGYQIVIGSRSTQREGAPVLRKVMAVGFIFIRDLLVRLRGIKDTQCGFKLFERKAALKIFDKLKVYHNKKMADVSSVSAGFDLEFLFVALKLGFDVKEIPVKWLHVETKNVNFIRDSVETLVDIFKIKYYDLLNKY